MSAKFRIGSTLSPLSGKLVGWAKYRSSPAKSGVFVRQKPAQTRVRTFLLSNIAYSNKCLMMKHQKDIGGRFSIFSNVGMVPAIIAGLDVKKVHKGALLEIENQSKNDFLKIAQYFRYHNNVLNINNSVVMTYSDALFFFGKWYLQLWAESLGKKNKGITPIHAVGTTDQHSQLQLYLDGPKDKFFTFITTDHANKGLKLHQRTMNENKLKYLYNKTMGDFFK